MTSLEGVLSASNAEPAGHPAVAGQVVLVMQGGGAQAAYQGGVYQALHEANLEPDWVIGTSIGAINGSIIAGNKVASRLERLREFWSRIESRPTWPSGPMFGNAANHFSTLLTGVPGFFLPNAAFLWGPEAAVGVEHAALYSVDPLRKLLPELVDFDLVNSGKPRFTLGLVSVRSGQIRYFDSRDEKIGLDHVLGSSAVPPTFPAVRIDGEAYWDGGIYSNTPVEAVFDDYPRRSSVVFAVQIWHSRGVEPESVAQVFARQKDIMFGSRSRSHIAAQARLHRLRHVVRTCSPSTKETPPRSRSSPTTAAQPPCICSRSTQSRSTARPTPESTIFRRPRSMHAGRPDTWIRAASSRGGHGTIRLIRPSASPCMRPTPTKTSYENRHTSPAD